MKQTHILPQIPKGITDPAVEKYLRDLQKVIRDKHEDDYMSSKKGGGGGVGADIIIKYEIEALITHWCLVDPTQLPAVYQICDGSVWKPGSYAETFWTPKGLTKIPNLCGYGLRAADRSSTQNDPDRDDRRQTVTGQVLTGGTTVSLPAFYCNVIKEARDRGRTVQIGINATDMFGTLSPVSTVTAVDLTTNIVTLTTGQALTVGATALIIKGDCIGSFQKDAFESHQHGQNGYSGGAPWGWSGKSEVISGLINTANWPIQLVSPPWTGKVSSETRIKNISYLPIMYVLLPSQALVNINGEIRNIDALIDKIGANSYVSQIVQNHVIDPYVYSVPDVRTSAVIIDCLTSTITTVKNESNIAIDMAINFGHNSTNIAFILERGINGVYTEIGSALPSGGKRYGMATVNGIDGTTTQAGTNIQFSDNPGQQAGTVITYRIKAYGYSAGSLGVNRAQDDGDVGYNERLTSNVRLTEFAGTPNINFGDTDVASVSEAKAGVDNTKVITPYGLRQAFNANGSAPVYACRAWCAKTTSTWQGGNISAITDMGDVYFRFTFTTPMPDTLYSALVSSDATWAPNFAGHMIIYAQNVNYFDVRGYVASGGWATYDPTILNVAVFR